MGENLPHQVCMEAIGLEDVEEFEFRLLGCGVTYSVSYILHISRHSHDGPLVVVEMEWDAAVSMGGFVVAPMLKLNFFCHLDMKECYIVCSPFSCSMVSVEVFVETLVLSMRPDNKCVICISEPKSGKGGGGGVVGCLQSMYRTMLQ